jgi:hypothetical protein
VDAQGQQRDPVVRGPRRLTAARAEAFVEAARLGLDYLPGEVVVKFKAGMGAEGVRGTLAWSTTEMLLVPMAPAMPISL